jgi:CRP-like cAMP-binding protein
MNTLINKLLLFDHLNEQQIALISRKAEKVHLEEGEYYTEPGHILTRLTYVDKGILRYNYYNNKAENITSSLIGEGNFIAPSGHLLFPIIPSDYLQAITECALLVIKKSSIEDLSATIPNWDNILKKVSQKAVLERRSRSVRVSNDANLEVTANKYLEKFPNLSKHLKANQMLRYLQSQQPK